MLDQIDPFIRDAIYQRLHELRMVIKLSKEPGLSKRNKDFADYLLNDKILAAIRLHECAVYDGHTALWNEIAHDQFCRKL